MLGVVANGVKVRKRRKYGYGYGYGYGYDGYSYGPAADQPPAAEFSTSPGDGEQA